MDYKLDHKCEHLRSPNDWAAAFTLSHLLDGVWNVQKFSDPDCERIYPTEAEAKERNRELARSWLAANDAAGRIFEEA